MNDDNKVFGANARVHIAWRDDLESLARKLSDGLLIGPFQIDHREIEPHDLLGSMEVFGYELWLENIHGAALFTYSLSIQTEHAHFELSEGRMHDLSLWLARFISLKCDVETLAPKSNIRFRSGNLI